MRNGTVWSQQSKLLANDGGSPDEFGFSVALSDDTALIGAEGKDAAYVFVRNDTSWVQQAKLLAAGSGSLGQSVAISGDTAVIGSRGAAYVFSVADTKSAVISVILKLILDNDP